MLRTEDRWWLVARAGRVLVAAVFLMAAWGKIDEPRLFAETVASYQLVPLATVSAIAYVLPWLEVLAAVLLLAGLWVSEARIVLAVMLVGFTGLKIYADVVGLRIDCGCFSGPFAILSKVFADWRGIALNVFLMAALIVDWYESSAASKAPRISVNNESAEAQGA